MASKFRLDGSIVPRSATRHVDERSEERVDAQSQTAMLRFRGRDHNVELVNLSPSGAMLIFSLIPHIGETISVQLVGRGEVTGSVCWVGTGKSESCSPAQGTSRHVEMTFSMIKARIADATDPSDRRRFPRLPIELEAKMRELGANGLEARVLNISERGFMAESEGHFEVGARIWLILPDRERASAVVKWIAGDKLGAEFAEPISLEGLDAPRA